MPTLIKNLSDKFGIFLIAGTIIAGLIGSLFADWTPVFPGALALLLTLATIQFLLMAYGFEWVMALNDKWAVILYFTVAISVLAGILYIADFGSAWIVALPLAGQTLSLSWRGTILATVAIFITELIVIWFLSYNVEFIFQVAPSLAVAMAFVMLFTYVTMRAEEQNKEIINLATQLQSANRQLREYATRAEDMAITKERNRMAREIHDSLGHYLTVVNVQLEAAKVTLNTNPEKAQAAIGKAQRLTQEGLADVRRSVRSLRESPLENRPVPQALAELIAEVEATGITAHLEVLGEPRPLPPNTALTVYRAVQEALTNVRKHAQASKVDVALAYSDDDTIALTVSDNGIGSDKPDGGFGLLGIRERVQLLRGQFNIQTAAGEGFRLEMSMPG